MDLLTLEVLAVDTPMVPVRDWDGDYWHAGCLSRFLSWSANRGGLIGIGHRVSRTSVAAPEALPSYAFCYYSACPHGRYKWTC
jgi:hypothetical protein